MKIFISALFLFLLAACDPTDLRQKAIQDVLRTDKEMCKRAVEAGFNRALMENAGDGFVKLSNGSYPIVGKLAFSEKITGKPDLKTITWFPEDADASRSGDLGYSWGNWKFASGDTTYYGNYVTIWKKDTDGKWRMLLDGGNSTPKPKDQ